MKKMLTIGFVRSEKLYEKRIAVLPCDIEKVIHKDCLYFEKGYAADFFISDEEYTRLGCHIVDKQEVLQQDIICDTKIGEATYLNQLKDETTIFGWIHAAANQNLTNMLVEKKMTCYAWEDMYEDERHTFWENNRIAGAGGVLNALQYCGFLAQGCQAAIIGRGDTAMGAYQILSQLGANARMYNREQEYLFKKELHEFDIIVMAVRWDTMHDDYLISIDDFHHIKKSAIVVDVSDDVDGAIQNSVSTTIKEAIYFREERMVYSVGNVPSIFFKTATQGISKAIFSYFDSLIEQDNNEVLKQSLIIHHGEIIDKNISNYQNKNNI
ncbi:MAG: hypothetical protein RR630_09420 [Coprobacillus sp.]